MLLFGADIKLAGSLSLAVSLPTMLVGFARYSRDRSFVVLSENLRFVLVMAAGSVVGSFIGGQLLGLVPATSCSAPVSIAARDCGIVPEHQHDGDHERHG